MPRGQTLPLLWLLSDQRNDSELESALRALPRGSGFIFRHYHLEVAERAARYRELAAIARDCHHTIILARDAELAAFLGADGVYGNEATIRQAGSMLRLGTAHNIIELQAAHRADADAVFVSPVFPTASHPGIATLGIDNFHALAQQSTVPVIALGGMDRSRAEELDWPRWGAIDGLCSTKVA